MLQKISGGNKMTPLISETISKIHPLDASAMRDAAARWDAIAKPLHSLGLLEDAVIQAAGIQGSASVSFAKKALVVFCADNGVVAEGVTQTGQEVTAIVAEYFLDAKTCIRWISEWRWIRRALPSAKRLTARKIWRRSLP